MKKNSLSQTFKSVSALLMLLAISVTFLPLSLFHHHASDKIVCHTYDYKPANDILQNEKAGFSNLTEENNFEECLFCTWQLGARLTYVIPEVVFFLPDFVKNRLSDFHLMAVEVFAVAAIPNKGPPAFLFF